MKKLIGFFFVLMFIFSCEKFDYKDVEPTSNCSLCGYAASLNGTYRGYAKGLGVDYEIPPSYNEGDSVTITVQQVFIGNSSIEDSTRMRFIISTTYDSWPLGKAPYTNVIEILSTNGTVEESENEYRGLINSAGEPEYGSYYYVYKDSIDVQLIVEMGSAQYATNLLWFGGVFKKI